MYTYMWMCIIYIYIYIYIHTYIHKLCNVKSGRPAIAERGRRAPRVNPPTKSLDLRGLPTATLRHHGLLPAAAASLLSSSSQWCMLISYYHMGAHLYHIQHVTILDYLCYISSVHIYHDIAVHIISGPGTILSYGCVRKHPLPNFVSRLGGYERRYVTGGM